MSLVLNVLDQSPVFAGQSPVVAVQNTVRLACEAEKLGYRRFWVSEHHGSRAFGSASPEILIARIASATSRIRVGAGGILLRHYQPLKVAEQFNLLEAMFPGRIDLGLGSTTGAPPRVALALRASRSSPPFEARIDELIGYLGPGAPDAFRAVPVVPAAPLPWVLGTSPASALLAAKRGLPFAVGQFLAPRNLDETIDTYHHAFEPSKWLERPRVNLALFVICADSEERALTLGSPAEAWLVQSSLRKMNVPFPTTSEALATANAAPGAHDGYDETELREIAARRSAVMAGTGRDIAKELRRRVAGGRVHEVTLVTIAEHFEDRLRSYQLVAEACGLAAPGGGAP
ncbi:LLM class flavin-dependent oxidoreductase [Pendulispora albinea]|uniref:LLM class flavin-dependent oxidoreductase n=1 Tax=Pendulispora albinea TaxID=2741071 RepID=A0ABZ2LYV6_9BACT